MKAPFQKIKIIRQKILFRTLRPRSHKSVFVLVKTVLHKGIIKLCHWTQRRSGVMKKTLHLSPEIAFFHYLYVGC